MAFMNPSFKKNERGRENMLWAVAAPPVSLKYTSIYKLDMFLCIHDKLKRVPFQIKRLPACDPTEISNL
jgi:hypothetical protein